MSLRERILSWEESRHDEGVSGCFLFSHWCHPWWQLKAERRRGSFLSLWNYIPEKYCLCKAIKSVFLCLWALCLLWNNIRPEALSWSFLTAGILCPEIHTMFNIPVTIAHSSHFCGSDVEKFHDDTWELAIIIQENLKFYYSLTGGSLTDCYYFCFQ